MKRKKFKTIYAKLLRQFLLTALIPIMLLSLALSLVTYVLSSNQTADQYAHSVSSAKTEMSNRVLNVYNIFNNLLQINGSSGIYSSDSLYSLITNNDTSNYAFDIYKLPNYRKIHSVITNNYLANAKYINGIYILMDNGNTYSFSRSYSFPTDYHYLDTAWYKGISSTQPNFFVLEHGIGYVFSDFQKQSSFNSKITFAKPLIDSISSQKIGAVLIDCNSTFFEPLSSITSIESEASFVMRDGTSVWYNTSAGLGEYYDQFISNTDGTEGLRKSLLAGEIITWNKFTEPNDLMIISSLPLTSFSSQYSGFFTVCVLVSLLAIIIAVISSVLVSRSFTRPIINLVGKMDSSSSKLPAAAEMHESQDELMLLYQKYNHMVNSIDAYINENYAYKLSLTEAKMHAIEAQIDTHFLYNTLECIYSMAIIEDADNIADVIKSLADMFRYVTLTSSPTVRLRNEIIYTQNYFTIQKARLEDKLHFYIEIPSEFYEFSVLKLFLQPLVENSIKHGFGHKDAHHIRIIAKKQEDSIIFTVSDNGIGISESRLNEVRERLAQTNLNDASSGIGLNNIYNRLKLFYGDQGNLTISSTYGQGTTVTVTMPIRTESETAE